MNSHHESLTRLRSGDTWAESKQRSTKSFLYTTVVNERARLNMPMGLEGFSSRVNLNTFKAMENRLHLINHQHNAPSNDLRDSLKKNFLMLSSVLVMKFGAGVVVVNFGLVVTFRVPLDGSIVFSAIALTIKTAKINFSFISRRSFLLL
jgi:hypothetical protein